ncbi:FAD-dependent monooxygenase [Pseudoteredinibacter isoporae]|uniref:FAD-dependent monooxygenase n=1 Tax=Pseudoteredinibacter isoporae TaxID=570281 RepID=UPI003133461D
MIGAGIGGLTTALFLERQGFEVQLFEQSNEIKLIGAGIILAHNAMQVFDKLNLKETITEQGKALTSFKIKTSKFEDINEINTQTFGRKFSVSSIAIKRSELQALLLKEIQTTQISLGKRVIGFNTEQETSIHFADGSSFPCDTVISADGIHSITRRELFKTGIIRKPGQTCWRGISTINLPKAYKSELNELWGKGSRFGFVEVSENQVYWYGLHNSKRELEQSELLDLFQNYAPIVADIITSTPTDNIHLSEISDLKPIPNWHKNTVCLLGDAAHATTPNMGQSACQAIEDAFVLSHYLGKHPAELAFAKFEESRKEKARRVVNMSWWLGYISQLESPVLSAIRNFLFRKAPKKYNSEQTEKIYSLPDCQ